MTNTDYASLLNRAAAYCSQAERAPLEVEQKLRGWEAQEEDIERIMQYLRTERFLDEERYVHAYVNDKFCYERWGRIKIAYSLRSKGVSDALVRNMMEEVIDEEKYLETLTDLMRQKMRGMKTPLLPNDRAKLYRFAAQRGFESGVVSRALSRLNIPDLDE